MPPSALKCIASWKKFFPEYEIREWNEQNFNVNAVPYTAQAYAAGKYAFVSDYARFAILYEHGGIYFDTDVEVVAPFDEVLRNGAFMGIESVGDGMAQVNPGLGMAAEAGHPFYAEMLEGYANRRFADADGNLDLTTIVAYTSQALADKGLKSVNEVQEAAGITVYPTDRFNPLDDFTGRLRRTPDTLSIHWFDKTWCDVNPWRTKLSRFAHRVLGAKLSAKLRKMLEP